MHSEYIPHLFGNIVCALDVETTALSPKKGEICQIAVVPIDMDYQPSKRLSPFRTYVKIKKPENCDPQSMAIHGITLERLAQRDVPEPEEAVERLIEWFNGLLLPVEKCVIPLAHNYPYEHSHMPNLLGEKLFTKMFHGHYRDGMEFACNINDKYAFAGDDFPFKNVGLKKLCQFFKITHQKPHDAYYDCLAEIEVYRNLLQFDR